VQLCDGEPDCPGGDDEANCPPESGTDISGYKFVISSVGHAVTTKLLNAVIQAGTLIEDCVIGKILVRLNDWHLLKEYSQPDSIIIMLLIEDCVIGKILVRLNDSHLLKEDSQPDSIIIIMLFSSRLKELYAKTSSEYTFRGVLVYLYI
jgi:hypothetical protein